MWQVPIQEFTLWQNPGYVFPYKESRAKPSLQRSLRSPHILPAPELFRRDRRQLEVRRLWKKSPPVPRVVAAGADAQGLRSARPWVSHRCQRRHCRCPLMCHPGPARPDGSTAVRTAVRCPPWCAGTHRARGPCRGQPRVARPEVLAVTGPSGDRSYWSPTGPTND